MANIACRQLHKTYDEKTAVLQPFDLEIADGEFIVNNYNNFIYN